VACSASVRARRSPRRAGELRGGLGGGPLVGADQPVQVGELLDRLVGAAGLQLVEPGAQPGGGVLRLLAACLRLRLLGFGARQGGDVMGELGAPLRAGLAAAGERIGGRPGVGAQVGGVGGEEGRVASSAAVSPSSVVATDSMSSNERAASAIRSSSTGRSRR